MLHVSLDLHGVIETTDSMVPKALECLDTVNSLLLGFLLAHLSPFRTDIQLRPKGVHLCCGATAAAQREPSADQ